MTPEGRVKAKIKKRLDIEYPDHWRFMPVQTGYGVPALDFLLCIDGSFVAIEAKAPGKKPTPLQETTMAEMREAGAIVCVVDGDESLDRAIQEIEDELWRRQ